MTLAKLAEIGPEIDRNWRRFDYDTTVFSRIACDVLARTDRDELDLPALAARTASARHLPARASSFGDARVLVWETPEFSIEVLIWHQGTTCIHEHPFCGAFQVLHGSSVHGSYRFEESRRLSAWVREGTVTSLGAELLLPGDIREIKPGPLGLCHSVFHLDAPTCSLVVRTPGEVQYFPQLDYFPPSLAVATQFSDNDPAVRHALDCTRLARRLGDDELQLRTLHTALRRLDLFRRLGVVLYMPPVSRSLRPRVVDETPTLFGELEDAVRAAILRRWLIDDCKAVRSRVHDPLQRFVLAAAMNAPSVEAMRVLLHARCPGIAPFEVIFSQVTALMESGQLTLAWGDGLPHERMLRSYLGGESQWRVMGEMSAREFDADDELNREVHVLLSRDSILSALQPFTRQLAKDSVTVSAGLASNKVEVDR